MPFSACLPALLTIVAAASPTPRTLDSFGAGVSLGTGLGTPLGLLGIEGRLDVTRWAFLTAGVGTGMRKGAQVGAMGHLRLSVPSALPERQWAFTAGYGASRGNHYWQRPSDCFLDAECGEEPEKEGMLWWHNFELGAEVRMRSPTTQIVTIRILGGLAVAGNPQDLHCFGRQRAWCESLSEDTGTGPYPYAGVSMGFWFQ
jgi:hypothetical protein